MVICGHSEVPKTDIDIVKKFFRPITALNRSGRGAIV